MSEQTHAKNVDNLFTVIQLLTSLGNKFDPSGELITLAALTDFHADCVTAMTTVNTVVPDAENKIGARLAAFKPVAKRSTAILKAAKAQGLEPEFIAHLRTTCNDLRGVRVTAQTPDNPETPDLDESAINRSSSNRSYAGILESVDKLVEQLKSNKNYKPNEAEYKIEGLEAWQADLIAKNNAAIAAKAAATAARANRDALMYDAKTGILARIRLLKDYLFSILGAKHPIYRQILALKFRDMSQ